jgi:cell division protein FtsI/penicillin-binding protein 2
MYERRLLRLFLGVAALLLVVLGRAFHLQVVRADEIVRDRESVLRSTSIVQPRRGEILWADGTPAVRNVSRFALRVDVRAFDAKRWRCGACGCVLTRDRVPETCADCSARGPWSAVAPPDPQLLARLLDLPADDVARALDDARRDYKRYRWAEVRLLQDHRFSAAAAAAVALRASDLPGIHVRAEPCRESDDEIRAFAGRTHVAQFEDVVALCDPERAARGLHVHTRDEAVRGLVGESGLERTRDERLRGVPGILERRPARRGEPAPPPEVLRPVVDGTPIRTTLRRDVQRVAQQVVESSRAAGASAAAAVVLDLRDGAVVAMASRSDDPYFHGIAALIPGSVFKIVPAFAALEAGIDPQATLDCAQRGWLRPGLRYTCTGLHPAADLRTAFAKSCNHYFMRRAEEAGAAALRDAYERLGFAEDVRLGIGVVPVRPLVRRFDRDTAQLGIGQAGALASPLQVATAYGRLATGGRRITPYVDRDVGPSKAAHDVDPVVARHAPLLLDAARRTVTEGTARNVSELAALGCAAGKSGTAEVDLPGGVRVHNAWFAGFAPHDAPRYVVAVVHEKVDRMHGADFAGPGAARLLEAALRSE